MGASCHSVEEAREAEALGCTYLTAGHIFATDCKMGAPPRGLDFLRSVCAAVALPVYAIGGISAGNFCAVRRCGAAGACVMSGAMTCEDPAAYLRSFEKGREHMTFDAHQLLLYAVTDRAWVGRQTLAEQIEDALLGGATMLQLREKELDRPSFLAEAREIKALCRRYGVPLIIDDDVEVALESGADGVHVGQADLPVAEIRRRAGRGFIIGATAKTVAQARAAEAAGADYLGVGAVFPSPTKQEAFRITPEQLREICAAVSIPAVAIGGISLENLPALRGGGMRGIAVISALFGAGDIRQAAGQLKQEALSVIGR